MVIHGQATRRQVLQIGGAAALLSNFETAFAQRSDLLVQHSPDQDSDALGVKSIGSSGSAILKWARVA